MRSPAALHAYQTSAVGFLYDLLGAALLADLGLGKTAIVLTLLARLKREGSLRRALVIGPLRVVNTTWPDEIGAWGHTRHLTHRVITGSAKERLAALASDADIHLVNRENVVWLVEQFIDFTKAVPRLRKPWPYDVCVIDELTSFGDHGSLRFKALKLVRTQFKRIYGLTATPTAEGFMKMFAMVFLLDGGERLGKFVSHYREAYFEQNVYTKVWKIKPGSEQTITDKVADIALSMRAVDYLPRGQPTYIDRPVHLTDKQLATYKRFERECFMELPDGTEIEAVHAAALATKLLQLASGVVYDAEGVPHFFHEHKIEALAELIEEAQGAPIIVAYWFKTSLARLQKAFPKAVQMDKKGEAVARWNAKKIPLLLVHPQSAGHGLNLQAGGSIIVFFDLPMSLELYQQAVGRVDRQGQTEPVRVYHLVACKTADDMAIARLASKQGVQEAFFTRLKEWQAENPRT